MGLNTHHLRSLPGLPLVVFVNHRRPTQTQSQPLFQMPAQSKDTHYFKGPGPICSLTPGAGRWKDLDRTGPEAHPLSLGLSPLSARFSHFLQSSCRLRHQNRVSQPQRHCRLGPHASLLLAVLYILGCSTASLAWTQQTPAASLPIPQFWQSKLSPDIAQCPLEEENCRGQSHLQLRTTALN